MLQILFILTKIQNMNGNLFDVHEAVKASTVTGRSFETSLEIFEVSIGIPDVHKSKWNDALVARVVVNLEDVWFYVGIVLRRYTDFLSQLCTIVQTDVLLSPVRPALVGLKAHLQDAVPDVFDSLMERAPEL